MAAGWLKRGRAASRIAGRGVTGLFLDGVSLLALVTLSRTAALMRSNCFAAIQSAGAIHEPPHATTFFKAS